MRTAASLSIRTPPAPGIDFEYVIHNADGGEVEHCGNGARCFVRFVRERGREAGLADARFTGHDRDPAEAVGPGRFEDAQIPLAMTATDLDSGAEMLFTSFALAFASKMEPKRNPARVRLFLDTHGGATLNRVAIAAATASRMSAPRPAGTNG